MGAGYDFSDSEEVIIEQREAAEHADRWDYLDEKKMSGELNGLNSRVTACLLAIKRMMTENDFKKAKDRLDALLAQDLSPEGWIFAFREANKEYFSPEKSAETKAGLSGSEKTRFETAETFYRDAGYLADIASAFVNIIRILPITEGFRLIRVKDNFDSAGFDEDLYKKIDANLQRITLLLNIDWSELDRFASNSAKFVEDNLGKFPRGELEKKYRAMRLEEYRRIINSFGLLDCFHDRTNGYFDARPEILAKTAVIDKYTYQVAYTEALAGPCEKTIAACRGVISKEIAEADKNCKTQSARFLSAAFHSLAETIEDFADMVLDIYKNFKDGASIAPYCFMKKLSGLSSVQPKYGFNPNTSDPWDSGTFYQEIYTDGAKAVSAHCRLFVYDHGVIFA